MIKERVEKVLEKIRPYIQSDGGDVELIEVREKEGIVRVQLHGACDGCPSAAMTLKGGIERMIKQEVPEIKEVQAV